MAESFAHDLRSRSRFVRDAPGVVVLRPNPRQLRALELTSWAEARVGNLGASPTRELLYSELLLLQREYMRLLQRAKPSQKRPLQDAHHAAYERLEALLNEIAPPQTTKPRQPKTPAPPVPPPGVDIGDLEGSPWA